ncbi:efflux RND transporter periplasmic adaptor subunit [bacterium]|nr:efflux RND transporter periplasmic adaptor subunit [bacterium]
MTIYNDYRETTQPDLRPESRHFLKQRDIIVLSALFVILLFAALVTIGCARNEAAMPDPEQPVPVRVVEATIAPHSALHRVSGLATADEEAMLSFKTGGVVQAVRVDIGERFRKGQILALLDTTEVAAMLTDAEQQALVARNDFERIKRLHDSDVVTDQQFEAARAGMERAEAGLRRARFNLHHSIIRAPFAGSVNMKLVNRGEIIGAGQPVFRVLSNDASSRLIVRISAPALLTSTLEEGQEIAVETEGHNEPGTGIIRTISRTGEPGTGGFPIKVQLPQGDQITPGLVVTVSLPEPPEPMIALPAISLSSMDEDRGYVYLVENEHAARWPVTIRMLDREAIYVAPTLPEGSVVIAEGAGYVSDGRRVTIEEGQK